MIWSTSTRRLTLASIGTTLLVIGFALMHPVAFAQTPATAPASANGHPSWGMSIRPYNKFRGLRAAQGFSPFTFAPAPFYSFHTPVAIEGC